MTDRHIPFYLYISASNATESQSDTSDVEFIGSTVHVANLEQTVSELIVSNFCRSYALSLLGGLLSFIAIIIII